MTKKICTIVIAAILILGINSGKAQMTAMDFSKNDCNGAAHHLYADLDSGKCVLLHFFMPNCGMCPPPAQALQNMADGVNAMHPSAVVGYAFPFNNTTTCRYSSSWTLSNSLPFYTPMDSGAAMVAHYGGFGMPTVVLLGGSDHRVIYASQSFSTSDTTAIRDSIMARQMSTTGVVALPSSVSVFSVFPNPAKDDFSVTVGLKEASAVSIELVDITGRVVATVLNEKLNAGTVNKKISAASLSNGNYLIKLTVNGQITSQHFSILR